MADLKRVYAAVTEETALAELDSFEEKWGSKYPKDSKIMEKQLGESIHLFQVSGSGPPPDLYDQCH